MKRSEKEAVVAEVAEKVSRARGLYLADFTGITVGEANELRREFRRAGIDYHVVKNTLVRKALAQLSGFDGVLEALRGPTAIAFSYDDPIGPAKIIQKFYARSEKLSLKVCVLERNVYDGSKLKELALLPTKPEIISSIVGTLQGQLAAAAGVVYAVLQGLVSVLEAVEKQKSEAGQAPAGGPAA